MTENDSHQVTTTILQYPTRCVECDGVMRRGTVAEWLGRKGEYIHTPSCPSPSGPAPPSLRGAPQVVEMWSANCVRCGELYGGRGVPADPFVCERCERVHTSDRMEG